MESIMVHTVDKELDRSTQDEKRLSQQERITRAGMLGLI